MNEPFTNAYKYAFRESANGIISITISESKSKLNPIVKDNGQGIKNSSSSQKTIRLDILSGLVDQIERVLMEASDESGTQFKISFLAK